MENGPTAEEMGIKLVDTQVPPTETVATPEVTEKDKFEDYYIAEKDYPPRCQPFLEEIKKRYHASAEEFKKDPAKIPDLDGLIKDSLKQVLSPESAIDISAGDGDLTPRGFYEWIPKELYHEIVSDLSSVKSDDETINKTITVRLSQLREYQQANIEQHLGIFTKSNYFSHSTDHLIELLKKGSILSRAEQEKRYGRSNFNTMSEYKTEGQEKDQICFHIDQVGVGYGKLGSVGMDDWSNSSFQEPRTSAVFLIPTLPVLSREDVSFYSGDGLHIFMDNGFDIPLSNTKIIPSERGLKQIRAATRTLRNTNPFSGRGDKVVNNEVLTPDEKTLLESQLIQHEGQEVTIPQDNFESSRFPDDLKPIVSQSLGEVSIPLREQFSRAHFVPTGEFGDGPGGSKIFKRKFIFT